MTIQCPECHTIFKVANDTRNHPCPFCNWPGKWKPEIALEDEITREIEHPALRGCH